MSFGKAVESYSAFLYPNPDSNTKARINLYCKEGYKLYLLFEDEPGVNAYTEATKIGLAYAPTEHYPRYVDLLRNEEPLHVTFVPERTPPRFVLYTSATEPVGEGEA